MTYHAHTYKEIADRFNDWMRINPIGANVTNRTLDIANSGQDWLTMYKPWSDMIKVVTLTILSSQADLPDDFARLINVHYDVDGDGRPEGYYYNRGAQNRGYKLIDTFAKGGGHSRVIKFFNTIGQAPILTYQYRIDDFAGEGDEYSFFPKNLLLLTMQMIHIDETGIIIPAIKAIHAAQAKALRDYEQAHHWVDMELRREIKDDFGRVINTYDVSLDGGEATRDSTRGLSRSTDTR